MPLYPATTCIHGTDKTLLSPSSGWFYVQILVLLSSIDLKNMNDKHSIKFSSDEMIAPGIFKMYLTEKQASYLQTENIAKLIPVEKKRQLQSAEDETLFVKATPNWQPPTGSYITSIIADNYFTVRGATASQLLQDDRVLFAEVLPEAKLANRYATGYVQSGSDKIAYHNRFFESDRIANRNGINGEGQIVTVIDSGLDGLHPFFRDTKREIPYNRTDLQHRKVVRYDAVADAIEIENGHGTHVAGTVAGNPNCVDCGFKMYSGMAPEAKIYFIDQGEMINRTHSKITADINWSKVIPNMRDMGSYITSNSWGYNYLFHSFTEAFDKLSYLNPDILHTFAAGNYFRKMTIFSPGDGKNILTIGATTSPKSRLYDNMKPTADPPTKNILISGNTSIIINTYKELNLWDLAIERTDKIPIDVEMIDYDENNVAAVNGKIVRIDLGKIKGDHCPIIQTLYDNRAAAAVFPLASFKCKDKSLRTNFILARYDRNSEETVKAMDRATFSFERFDYFDEPFNSAEYTSKGPTWSSITKPEIAAPGNHIISARSGNPYDKTPRPLSFESLSNQSGTSMATPIMSASAALIRQFFVEKYYPTFIKGTGRDIIPSATLLRAMLINAAVNPNGGDQSVPDNEVGYGIPILSNIFGYNGLNIRVIDNQKIESHEHHVYKITVTNKKPLSIVLSYLDPPVSHDKGYVFFADLDLYVETPDGKILVANIKPVADDWKYSDSFATNEKVLIESKKITNGEYKIHITSSVFPMEQDVKYSLVITGDFDNITTADPLPMTKGTTCPDGCGAHGKCVSGQCQCDNYYAGFTCKQVANPVAEGSLVRTKKLPEKEITFYTLVSHKYPISAEYPLVVSFSGVTIEPVACFSKKMGPLANPDWSCYRSSNKTTASFRPAVPIFDKDPIYIAVFQAGRSIGFSESDTINFRARSTENNLKPGSGPAPPPPAPAPPKDDPGGIPEFPPLPPLEPIDPNPDPVKPEDPAAPPVNPVDPAEPEKTRHVEPDQPRDPRNENEKQNGSHNKQAVIAVGASIGAIVCVGCIAIGVIYLMKRRRPSSVKIDHRLSDEL